MFELSSLDGTNGFQINGVVDPFDSSSSAVSGAGDVNGDGIDDLIIGIATAPDGPRSAGQSYVVFGSNGDFSSSLNLSSLDGTNGFVIDGAEGGDESGRSVSGAGDVNGDGIDDLIIGAPDTAVYGNFRSGLSYVVFGSNVGFSPSFSLNDLNGTNGFQIDGDVIFSYSGQSVSGAGDVNGDGVDDLIIGAPGGDNDAGESYVVFGSSAGFSQSFDLDSFNLDGNTGFQVNGVGANDESGNSVSGAGDVNGDGIDDVIIGARLAGESYVVFGSNDGFSSSLFLEDLDGASGFVIDGAGSSVSGAGDVNDDGIDDLIIGAPTADPNGNFNAGESYVVFGSNVGFSPSLNLSSLDGTNGFVINGIDGEDVSGASVSGAGDVNGDGIDDLIIGAPTAFFSGSDRAGESYVVFGSDGGFSSPFNLSSLDGTNGFQINGAVADDRSGVSVSGAGDVNGDGVDDLIIGGYRSSLIGNGFAGASYVVFGRAASSDVLKGDVDMDGDIDFLDIGPFVAVLGSGSFQAEADVDCSGFVDFLDIQPFIELLSGN